MLGVRPMGARTNLMARLLQTSTKKRPSKIQPLMGPCPSLGCRWRVVVVHVRGLFDCGPHLGVGSDRAYRRSPSGLMARYTFGSAPPHDMRQSHQESIQNQYANRSRNRVTPFNFGREPSLEIQVYRVCSYVKLSRSHESSCLAGRLSPPLVRSCGLQYPSRCGMI